MLKFLLVIALAMATASAFEVRSEKTIPLQRFMPVVKHEGRIAGGQSADILHFSYQVGLSLKKSIFGDSWCGGSLIAPEWVLTAAHCMRNVYEITVYLGGTKRAQAEVEINIVRNSDNVITHEGFISKTMLNDIALIKIPPVKYSDKIRPIRLHKISCKSGTFPGDFAACNDGTFAGDFATASGWGQLGDNAWGVPSTLQSVTLRIISNEECSRTFGRSVITDGNLCVATKDDNVMRSTCDGDSGGPLVLKGTNVQIGLTSFGAKNGCELGYPVAFTRIASFKDWIVAKTGITV